MSGSAKPAGVKAAWVRLPPGQAEDGDSVPPATTVWCVMRACAAACPMANRLEPHWASSVAAPAVSQPAARLATLAILPSGPTVLPSSTTSGVSGMAAKTADARFTSVSWACARCQPVMAVRAAAVTIIRVINPPGLFGESYRTASVLTGQRGAIAPAGRPWVIACAPRSAAGQSLLCLQPRQPLADPRLHRAVLIPGWRSRPGGDRARFQHLRG